MLGLALAVGRGVVGCQLALRADPDGEIRCDNEGERCPGDPNKVCTGGICRGCVPNPKGELCNGVDDNCNSQVDEGYDVDGDTYQVCGRFQGDGTPMPNTADCNDNDPAVHPGALEVCNGFDDNCDGKVDEEPNDCSQKTQECWSERKDATGKPAPGCITPGDCRKYGCTDGGCDTTTGTCTDPDCTHTGGGCKPGYTCDAKSHNCVPSVGPGEQCTNEASCPTGLHCLDSVSRGAICTKTCCQSSDCPDGLLCRQLGNSAAVCIKDAAVPVGAKLSNAGCNAGSECRSGVCTGNKCIDSCCGNLTCGTSGTCSLRSADETFTCRASLGTGTYGDACSDDTECKSGLCYPLSSGWLSSGFCSQQCCSSSDCADSRDRCELKKYGTKPVVVCSPFSSTSTTGKKRGGDTCATATECRSNRCTGLRCDDSCCADTDCVGGWICKPKFDGTYSPMRCVDPAVK